MDHPTPQQIERDLINAGIFLGAIVHMPEWAIKELTAGIEIRRRRVDRMTIGELMRLCHTVHSKHLHRVSKERTNEKQRLHGPKERRHGKSALG